METLAEIDVRKVATEVTEIELPEVATEVTALAVTEPVAIEAVSEVVDAGSPPESFITAKKRQAKQLIQMALAAAVMMGLVPAGAFAQTPPAAPAAFGTAVTNIVNMIKSICGVGIVLLLVAGFGLIMWGVAPRHAW